VTNTAAYYTSECNMMGFKCVSKKIFCNSLQDIHETFGRTIF
jgi:hypothetical protein